jgi:hypothetical protein
LNEKIKIKDQFIIDTIEKHKIKSNYQVRDFYTYFKEIYIPHEKFKEYKIKKEELDQE